MNFTLISTLLIGLTCIHVTESMSELEEEIGTFFQEKTTAVQDVFLKVKAHKLTQQTQRYLEDISDQFLPVAEKTLVGVERAFHEARKIGDKIGNYIWNKVKPYKPHIVKIIEDHREPFKKFDKILDSILRELYSLNLPILLGCERFVHTVEKEVKSMLPPKYVKLFHM